MIGVAVDERELDVVREFFELFKTPWELVVPGRKYRVILDTSGKIDHLGADVVILYGSGEYSYDRRSGVKREQLADPLSVEWRHESFPVYGKVGVFAMDGQQTVLQTQGKSVGYQWRDNGRVFWRIGYDLFDEVRHLLTKGQPAEHALTPALELHIDFLRNLLRESNVAFVEMPSRPAGYDFICCLTHDVDFFGIRRHLFDRTIAGFLYRSSVGSLIDLVRGRRSLADAGRNWLALCSLPLVVVGVLPDFWRPFEDYAEVEDMRRSTFFLVPFKGKAGVSPDGMTNAWRAVPYGIGDVREEVKRAAHRGSEIGLHGIDAWRDSNAGKREMEEVTSVSGTKSVGVRMHWLYFDADAPRRLENAGFDYDSTCGFNETIGYRAGTSQVFCPLGCSTLMELPMAIMDSALFASGRMGLTPAEALRLAHMIIANVKRFGGTLVINWHERSLAPERLLGRVYGSLLTRVEEGNRVWFARANEAVEWFRWRRSISFLPKDSSGVSVKVSAPSVIGTGGEIHIHRPGQPDAEIRLWDGATPVEVWL